MTADEAKQLAAAVTVDQLYLDRATDLMTLAFGVGITREDSRKLIAQRLEEWSRLDETMTVLVIKTWQEQAASYWDALEEKHKVSALVRELFAYLDREEESDEGRVFKPVNLSCCRAAWADDINRIMTELKATIDME